MLSATAYRFPLSAFSNASKKQVYEDDNERYSMIF